MENKGKCSPICGSTMETKSHRLRSVSSRVTSLISLNECQHAALSVIYIVFLSTLP